MYNMPDDFRYEDNDAPNHYDYLHAQEKLAKVQSMVEDMIDEVGESHYTMDILNELKRIRKVLEG